MLYTNNAETKDLILYLFDVYEILKNNKFKIYIQDKNTYKDNQKIILKYLIEKVYTRYKNLIRAKVWNKKDSRNSRIYILETQV